MFTKHPQSPSEIKGYLRMSRTYGSQVTYVMAPSPRRLPEHQAYLLKTLRVGEAVIHRHTLLTADQGSFENGERWASIQTIEEGAEPVTEYYTPKTTKSLKHEALIAQGLWHLLVRPDASDSKIIGQRVLEETLARNELRRADFEQETGLAYHQVG